MGEIMEITYIIQDIFKNNTIDSFNLRLVIFKNTNKSVVFK